MGSDSDLSVMQEAAAILSQLGVEYELTIVSAHRTPDRLVDYGKNAHLNGIGVVIAGAGGAAPAAHRRRCPGRSPHRRRHARRRGARVQPLRRHGP